MKPRPFQATMLAATLLLVAVAPASATLTSSTNGSTVTFTENFNGGTSFVGGLHVPVADGYLTIGPTPLVSSSASLSLTVPTYFSDLRLSFWYGTLGAAAWYEVKSGLVPMVTLSNSAPSNLVNIGQMVLLNPGAGGLTIDKQYTSPVFTFASPMSPGTYSLEFASSARALKIDDLTIQVTAVPEPGTYALMLMGFGAVGWMALRRRMVVGMPTPAPVT